MALLKLEGHVAALLFFFFFHDCRYVPCEHTRSSCFAGYKACVVPSDTSNPSAQFFDSVRQGFGTELSKRIAHGAPAANAAGCFDLIRPPGALAGHVTAEAADSLLSGLVRPGTAVSSAIIDAHSGLPGAGVGSTAPLDQNTLVAVLGTSGCYMMSSKQDAHVPGMIGKVQGRFCNSTYVAAGVCASFLPSRGACCLSAQVLYGCEQDLAHDCLRVCQVEFFPTVLVMRWARAAAVMPLHGCHE